jgi:ABC-type glutathione transport system ATPase component
MQTLLSAKNITKYYHTFDGVFSKSAERFAALNDVSLDLVQGVSLGIVGQSGSGKSTFAKILADIIPADSGEVLYKGEIVNRKSPAYKNYRRNVQMVFQDPDQSLNPRLTVWGTLKDMLLPMHGRSARDEAAKLMDMTGLAPEHLDRYPFELSGGQKQRVSIARALCMRPDVIIADEPVSGLDVSVQAQILNLMRELKSQGITFIFISHDLAVVRWLCDEVAVLKDGNVVEYGDTESVINNPSHSYTKELIRAS